MYEYCAGCFVLCDVATKLLNVHLGEVLSCLSNAVNLAPLGRRHAFSPGYAWTACQAQCGA